MDRVSKRLWQWRKRSELSLKDVRLAVNEHLEPKDQLSSRSSINNYEHRSQPPLKFLIALKRAYPQDVDIDWILFGDDRPWEGGPEYSERLSQSEAEWLDQSAERSRWRAPLGHRGGRLLKWFLGSLFWYPLYEDQERLDELDQWFVDWAAAPSDLSRHFVPMRELTSAEAETYCYALLAAIRPLLRVVRGDKSRHVLLAGGAWMPEGLAEESPEEPA